MPVSTSGPFSERAGDISGAAARLLAGALERAGAEFGSGEAAEPGEELTIDEDLPLLGRVLHYALHGTPLQKQVFVREIPNCVAEVGLEVALDELIPLFAAVATDADATVRQALAQQVPRVAELLAAPAWPQPEAAARAAAGEAQAVPLAERAYRAVLDTLLPAVRVLIVGEGLEPAGGRGGGGGLALLTAPQVTDSACAALLELTRWLREADVGAHVLTLVLCLAHDDASEERRVVAASLLGELAPLLTAELAAQVRA